MVRLPCYNSAMPAPPSLLEPAFLRQLEQLSLLSKRAVSGQLKGEKRSPRRGTAIEFADYRDYSPGDDPRRIDWNSFARLDRLFLKLFMEEEELHVTLLLDASRSMDFGRPTKLEYGRRVAAALGYIALTSYDRVSASLFGERLGEGIGPLRGRAQSFPLFAFLQQATAAGETGFAASLREYARRARRPGVAVVISDFFDADYQEGLKALLARRFQITLVQVLDDAELQPALRGDLKLVDAETGVAREISVSPALLRDYQAALDRFCGDLHRFCRRYGLDYLRAATSTPFEELVLHSLRRVGRVG